MIGDRLSQAPSRDSVPSPKLDVLAIDALSGLDFLEAAFECYRTGRVFSISRPDTDLSGLVAQVTPLHLPATPRRGWGTFQYTPRHDEAPAQIVFTSGTEGRPKAIVLSHRNLADVVARLNAVMAIDGSIREYVGVPVTYSFGLGRVRAVSAVGGSVFLPERFDPGQIRALLEAGEINAISAVPSLWQMVLATPEIIGTAGEKVRWIEIGSQYMSDADKRLMKQLFPNARIVQHYGLTEASRTTFLTISDRADDALASVGEVTGDVRVVIGDEGAIRIAGAHVALGRLHEGGRIQPLVDDDGYLTTQDVGELRDGHLHFLGRRDDQINVSGVKLGAEALENDIAALVGDHTGFAATGVPDRQRGEAVLLVTEQGVGDRAALIETAARIALERRGISANGVLRTMRVATLPRTGTNKVQRRQLRDQWSAQAAHAVEATAATPAISATASVTAGTLSPDEQAVATAWQRILGAVPLAATDTFYDGGGDSLSSVQIGIVMELAGFNRPSVRGTLEGLPLAEVAQLSKADAATPAAAATVTPLPERTARNWALSLTRGVMVLSVLTSHWGPGLFGRLGITEWSERVMGLIYRMGTPGFATVFGIGIGFLMLPNYAERPAQVNHRMRSSFWLVLLGLVLLAVAHLTRDRLLEGETTQLDFVRSVYNVLLYYTVMLGTAPWWMKVLSQWKRPVWPALFLAPGLWLLWQFIGYLVAAHQQQTLLELPRLMVSTGSIYALPKMAAVTAAGIAAGWWYGRQEDPHHAGTTLLGIGGLGMLLTVSGMLESYGEDAFSQRQSAAFSSLTGLGFYVSISMALLGGCLLLILHWHTLTAPLRGLLKAFIAFGGLALPIYVFHALVIPVKDILKAVGAPGSVALLLPLGLFLAGLAYAWRRLYRMYFN